MKNKKQMKWIQQLSHYYYCFNCVFQFGAQIGVLRGNQMNLWAEEMELNVWETKVAWGHRTEYWRGELHRERTLGFPWMFCQVLVTYKHEETTQGWGRTPKEDWKEQCLKYTHNQNSACPKSERGEWKRWLKVQHSDN